MTGIYRIIGLLIVLNIWACKQEEPLPVLGLRDVDEKGNEIVHQVADFTFIDHLDNSFTSKKTDERILVMNYFFTSCPTICPKMTDNLVPVFEDFQNEEDIVFVSATVDPKRDDPHRLRLFMESHKIPENKNWHFVTGDKKTLYDFARNQIYLSAMEDVENVEEDFIHSEKVVLIDRKRHIRGYYTGTDKANMKKLAKDIKRLK